MGKFLLLLLLNAAISLGVTVPPCGPGQWARFTWKPERYTGIPLEKRDYDGVARPGDRLTFEEKVDRQPYAQIAYGKVEYRPEGDRGPKLVGDFQVSATQFDGGKRRIILSRAFLDDTEQVGDQTHEIPRRVGDYRTSVLATLRLMKSLMGDTPPGKVDQFVLGEVVNFKTLLQLHLKEKAWEAAHPGQRYPASLREEALRDTPIYRYAESVARESGHRITGVHLEPYREVTMLGLGLHSVHGKEPISNFTDPWRRETASQKARARRNEQLRQEWGVSAGDKIFARFSVVLEVAPLE